jgi:outer membrane protein assembly factor BamB
MKVLIPRPLPNEKWYKSDGHHYLVPSNPELSHPLIKSYKINTGKGASDSQHLTASPIIADNKIFTISANSIISAFSANDIRKRLWQLKLKLGDKKDYFSSAAGISYYDGKIYATTGYNEVFAIDAINGKIIWTRNINSVSRSAPEAKENIIYVNTIDNKLYALDAKDGSILWTHAGSTEEISMFGSSSPVVYDNQIIAPYSSGEIFALKISDGSEIWSDVFSRRAFSSASSISDIDAAPVVSFGKLFVISSDGVLAASDIKSGKRLWEQQISGRQSPWVAGDFLYVISSKNELICIYIPTGGIKWVKQLKSYTKEDSKGDPIIWSGPVLAGDYLWAVASNGKLTAFSPRSGDIEYERKVESDIYVAPIVAYGKIYLYNDDADLVSLSANNTTSPNSNPDQEKIYQGHEDKKNPAQVSKKLPVPGKTPK